MSYSSRQLPVANAGRVLLRRRRANRSVSFERSTLDLARLNASGRGHRPDVDGVFRRPSTRETSTEPRGRGHDIARRRRCGHLDVAAGQEIEEGPRPGQFSRLERFAIVFLRELDARSPGCTYPSRRTVKVLLEEIRRDQLGAHLLDCGERGPDVFEGRRDVAGGDVSRGALMQGIDALRRSRTALFERRFARPRGLPGSGPTVCGRTTGARTVSPDTRPACVR